MAERTRVRKNSPPSCNCFTLKLPPELACTNCKPACEAGVDRRRNPKCREPWLAKCGSHQQNSYAKKYEELRAHLSMLPGGDVLVDEFAYGRVPDLSSDGETYNSSRPTSPEHVQAAQAPLVFHKILWEVKCPTIPICWTEKATILWSTTNPLMCHRLKPLLCQITHYRLSGE